MSCHTNMEIKVTFKIVPQVWPVEGGEPLPYAVDRYHFSVYFPGEKETLECYSELPNRNSFKSKAKWLLACKGYKPLEEHAKAFFRALRVYQQTGIKK